MFTKLVQKSCSTCGSVLDVAAFCRDASRSDGLSPRCKPCVAIIQRKYQAQRKANYEANRRTRIAQAKVKDAGGRGAQRSAQWRKDNPEKYRAGHRERNHRRRVQMVNGGIFLVTARDVHRLITRFGGRCAYCQTQAWEHLDHVVPISRGGRHSIGNLLPACAQCNMKKHSRYVMEWKK